MRGSGDLIAGLLTGNRTALAQLLTIIEQGGPDADAAISTLTTLPPQTSSVVGLTGPPGAGKSTIVDRLVSLVRTESERCAVIAVDPSSPLSGGAILGDRVRLSQGNLLDDGVFLRSMAARRARGGLAEAVPAAVQVLAAGGWPWILIETVGVGQSEVDIAGQADTTVVVETPESGDEIQANKAGLAEVADIFVVNKSDRPGAERMARDLRAMLHLGPSREWNVPVIPVCATGGSGMDELWTAVRKHRQYLEASGEGGRRQHVRRSNGLHKRMLSELKRSFERVQGSVAGRAILADLDAGRLDPESAARRLAQEMAFEPPYSYLAVHARHSRLHGSEWSVDAREGREPA